MLEWLLVACYKTKLSDTIHYLPASFSSQEARNIISTFLSAISNIEMTLMESPIFFSTISNAEMALMESPIRSFHYLKR